MTVYKRGGVYWYAFERKGKRFQGSTGVGDKRVARTIEAAHRTRLAKIEVGLEEANPIEAPSFPAAMKAFLNWSKTTHADKPETTRRYSVSAVALEEFFSKKKLGDITVKLVERFIEWRLAQKVKAPAKKRKKDPRAVTDKPIQPATVNRELACLRHLFNYFIGQGVKVANPVKDMKFLAENEDTFYILSDDDESKYLNECSQPLHDVAIMILETGMRPDEVYLMRRSCLHLDKGFYKNPKGKTPSARRRIELSRRATAMLKERLAEIEGEWVFPSTRKEGVPIVKLNAAHNAARQRAKLPRFRIYDLRHTWATRMLESGAADLLTLASMLGHKRLDMVMKYAHPTDGHKREAIRKFEESRSNPDS
jgi:integrase